LCVSFLLSFGLVVIGRTDLGFERAFADADAAAGLDGFGQFDDQWEHQQFAYGREHRAVNHTQWWAEEAPYYQADADRQCDVEYFHGEFG